jgi:plastocyanin
MKRAVRSWALALLLAFAFATPALAGTVTVQVSHGKLDPSQVKIHTGDTVVFHNTVEMPGGHTVVSDDGQLSSPPLAMDGSWSHTFEKPGTYGFHIKEHPNGKTTVVVE